MDTFYNYPNNPSINIIPPYNTNITQDESSLDVKTTVIPPTQLSYAYRSNYSEFVPQQNNHFKGLTINQTPFLFFQDHRKDYKSAAEEMTKGYQTVDTLSEVFFSDKNIKYVQQTVTKIIFKLSKGKIKIEDQPFLDILLKMQDVYYMYGRFLQFDVDKQVKELNYITIKELLPEIKTQIEQKLCYIRDISYPPTMMPQPINVNKAGRRSNRSISSIYELS